MTQCPRAGCGGTLDEDRFCDTCGLDEDETNNGFTAEQASIKHGRPS